MEYHESLIIFVKKYSLYHITLRIQIIINKSSLTMIMSGKAFVPITFEQLQDSIQRGDGDYSLKVDSEIPSHFGLSRGNPSATPTQLDTRDLEFFASVPSRFFINLSLEMPH